MNATGRRCHRGSAASACAWPSWRRPSAPPRPRTRRLPSRPRPRSSGSAAANAPGGGGPDRLGRRVDRATGPAGVMIDIWHDLAGRLGMDDRVRPRADVRRADASRSLPGTADVALGPLAITEERERIARPHASRLSLRACGSPSASGTTPGFLAAMRSLLSWQLLALLGIVPRRWPCVSGHLLWWFERRPQPDSFPPSIPAASCEAMWWIASTIVTGGCDDKHVDSAPRPHARLRLDGRRHRAHRRLHQRAHRDDDRRAGQRA